ncbi:hypothetical protein P775_04495 [Puniceibacterium antarcticum]|uniref:DUF1850 domain-containing protein n=1 Tax=Puniceibacterium antarcticum TaxID=1206336 RepID=A0A2G8RIL2_9RHOB|nr:DUF1850 domain-containing protein [Puniceibacterium antarcticum]PIL21424.1 hypothetical protein P775_04495 [Puniceibacterium antarcticum]
MSACLAIGALALHLSNPAFTLSWRHSVEKTEWEESWTTAPDGLTLTQSRIKGSGAGMEPGPDAILKDGWWISSGHLRVPRMVLAASGSTGVGWTLCADGTCHTIGAAEGDPIIVAPCNMPL